MHQPSTGFPALDQLLNGINPGDNIVWQVDSIDDSLPFVRRLCAQAEAQNKPLVYFRFASHKPLAELGSSTRIHRLDPDDGFEKFITEIHETIGQTGQESYFIFDSLSSLAVDSFSERMIGNFFMLTCPYLFEQRDIAYFMVLKNYHSYHAALPIEKTTQVLLNIYRHNGTLHIHPLKVQGRHSATMHMLHAWKGDQLVPVKESAAVADVITSSPWPGLQSASYRMVGMWDQRFMRAEEILNTRNRGECTAREVERCFSPLFAQLISRDKKILALAEEYLDYSDIIDVWKHVIGSGMIGGKAAGMLLAQAILRKAEPRLAEILEPHDSFYIGSDIFYSFLVQNECWEIHQRQKSPATLFYHAEEGRRRILEGSFPDYIISRFADMLDYYGQCPIIVRSSSLLEDSYGNAFAGKYESVFCVNQGTREARLEEFLNAVRCIYASTMSERALAYRARRKVLDKDEQMALLVQRVSGVPYGDWFCPQVAGVGLSYNPYVWDEAIDPNSGMLRLVFGLGTRAVNRADDDYTRVVALNAPLKRPEGNSDEIRRYSQKRVDGLDLSNNIFASDFFVSIANKCPDLPIHLFAAYDEQFAEHLRRTKNSTLHPWMLDFSKVFNSTPFIGTMREIFDTLRKAYGCEVDIEFTANFRSDGQYKINLVQCRPLQIQVDDSASPSVADIPKESRILEAHGAVIGQRRIHAIDRIVYVSPEIYSALSEREQYSIARLIGRLMHTKELKGAEGSLLIGPGRWGTTTPSLGVPVSFAEIETVSAICEIDSMDERIAPDLSLGTHFFNDLVESNMLYIGFLSSRSENYLNREFFQQAPNRLGDILADDSSWSEAVHVIDACDVGGMCLSADLISQKAVLHRN